MRASLYTIVLLAGLNALVCGHASENEAELADLDAMGSGLRETARAGGFFSALQTSGSFVMVSAGGFEEAALLGENVATRLKANVQAAEANMQAAEEALSRAKAAMATGAIPSLNSVAKPDLLGGTSNVPFDWTQCVSEGGSKKCALCDDAGGVLPCSKVEQAYLRKGVKKMGHKSSKCLDSKVMANQRFFYVDGVTGGPSCASFRLSALKGFAKTAFGQWAPLGPDANVFTKVFVTHPQKASRSVGMILVKRVVTHHCSKTTTSCDKGALVADVFKTGLCVKCTKDVFAHTLTAKMQQSEQEAFIKCLPGAFKSDGSLKNEYACTGKDVQYAQASLMSY